MENKKFINDKNYSKKRKVDKDELKEYEGIPIVKKYKYLGLELNE